MDLPSSKNFRPRSGTLFGSSPQLIIGTIRVDWSSCTIVEDLIVPQYFGSIKKPRQLQPSISTSSRNLSPFEKVRYFLFGYASTLVAMFNSS
jgi:hypothetical protein